MEEMMITISELLPTVVNLGVVGFIITMVFNVIVFALVLFTMIRMMFNFRSNKKKHSRW